MQRDEEELPPNDLDQSPLDSPQLDSPQSEPVFEELADSPPDEAVSFNVAAAMDDETVASDATGLNDSDGMTVIRAIEDSLARNEAGPPPADTAESPPNSAAAPLTSAAEGVDGPLVSLNANGAAGAGAPTLLPVNWSPFMKLVLGNTPPPRAMEEGDVERPWASVNPPTAAETARHSPMLAIERKGGGGPAISVFVQVHLSDDAIRRVAELTVREEANKSQHQIEVVAKRVFDIETGLFRLEAERRQLWR